MGFPDHRLSALSWLKELSGALSADTAALNMHQRVAPVASWPLPAPVKEIQRGVAQ